MNIRKTNPTRTLQIKMTGFVGDAIHRAYDAMDDADEYDRFGEYVGFADGALSVAIYAGILSDEQIKKFSKEIDFLRDTLSNT